MLEGSLRDFEIEARRLSKGDDLGGFRPVDSVGRLGFSVPGSMLGEALPAFWLDLGDPLSASECSPG